MEFEQAVIRSPGHRSADAKSKQHSSMDATVTHVCHAIEFEIVFRYRLGALSLARANGTIIPTSIPISQNIVRLMILFYIIIEGSGGVTKLYKYNSQV